MAKYQSIPIQARVWSKVTKGADNECWLWRGAATRKHIGYGQLPVNGKNSIVTRHIWAFTFGPIPEGQVVMHTCDVSLCCNPAHLRLGTQADNMADMKTKGRSRAIPKVQKEALTWGTWHDIIPYVTIGKLTKLSDHTAGTYVPKSSWKELSI